MAKKIQIIISTVYFRCIVFIGLILLTGCGKRTDKHSATKEQIAISLDVQHMPEQAPQDLQAQLVWGLWNLDEHSIVSALAAGARLHALASSVKGMRPIPEQNQLSPYALILEGYLNRTYMEENFENIRTALDQMYTCIQYLIENNISIDQGVVTIGAYPTMREFIHISLARLYAEKNSPAGLDEEGLYSLLMLEKIQALINKHQPR